MIPLGPFDVHQLLGRGGMCEVWKGEHRTQGFPVAIKVISQELARQPRYLRGFREEVRSVAGLSHPSIVEVFDYGQISEEAHHLSSGKLPMDSPYLVMELGESSLQHFQGRLHWAQLYPLILSILDALAHAHARGVVHRDIKPENILFFHHFSKAKLADFGLAWGHDDETPKAGAEEEDRIAGTPAYMAPEQFERSWRDYGPWTDLYALGCTIYALLTGRAPFGSEGTIQAMMFAHLCEPVPLVPVELDVPKGVDEWLQGMMAKEPSSRFERAADAAWALMKYEPQAINDETIAMNIDDIAGLNFDDDVMPGGDSGEFDEIIPLGEDDLLSAGEPTLNTFLPWDLNDAMGQQIDWSEIPSTRIQRAPVRRPKLPPIADHWDEDLSHIRSLQMTEVGLGLYGLRAIPLIDREVERQQLWRALQQVSSQKKAQVLALVGPSGYGKSRLARAMYERVHELGAATPFRAIHDELRGPGSGLGPMLSRHLRCTGLSHGDIEARLRELSQGDWDIEARDIDALAEYMAPGGDDDDVGQTVIRFSLPTERYTLLERYLSRQAQRRPVLLWLDDVQWGLDSLQFVKHVLERQQLSPQPLLILLTAREESLLSRKVEANALSELLEHPLARKVDVGPLPSHAHASLIRELLHLRGDLAREIEERTAGNPLFAIQLVGDWVQRGALECGPEGFLLRDESGVALPDDLHEVWTHRIYQALDGFRSTDLHALELAATLGLEVDGAEWRRACQLAGLQPADALVDKLLEQRLAESEDGPEKGWSFIHTMLRESLERGAREAERWASHNRWCAEMLLGKTSSAALERRGKHLLEAGLKEEAVKPLLESLWDRMDAQELPLVRQLFDQWLALLEEMRWPPHHEYWGEAWLLEARYARGISFYEVAREWADRAVIGAKQYRWEKITPKALLWSGYYGWLSGGDPDECWEQLKQAESRARALNDRETLFHCCRQIGDFLSSRGLLDEAHEYFEWALQESTMLKDPTTKGRACYGLAIVARQRGEHEEAWQWVRNAQTYYEAGGHRRGQADCLNVFGDLARLEGKLEEAQGYYHEGLELSYALGTGNEALFELNLGLVLIERGDYGQARPVLERAQAAMAWRKRALFEGAAHLTLLPCLAYQRDWHAWHHHVAKALTLLSGSKFYDVDLAKAATLAGQLAEEAQAPTRAKEAYQLALEQWENLERTEEAGQIHERLRALV